MLRVAQSGLANIRQHSAAQEARISVANEDGILSMVITDDGTGFDPSSRIDSESGYGLAAMRSRLVELGGALAVTSSKEGTTLTATLPIREPR